MKTKPLTIKELIEKLSKYDENLPVMIYAFEDGSFAYDIKIEPDQNGERLYFKGDHPFEFDYDPGQAICIIGDC